MKNTDNGDDNGWLGAIRQFQFPECTDLRARIKRSGLHWLDPLVVAGPILRAGIQFIGGIGKVST